MMEYYNRLKPKNPYKMTELSVFSQHSPPERKIPPTIFNSSFPIYRNDTNDSRFKTSDSKTP